MSQENSSTDFSLGSCPAWLLPALVSLYDSVKTERWNKPSSLSCFWSWYLSQHKKQTMTASKPRSSHILGRHLPDLAISWARNALFNLELSKDLYLFLFVFISFGARIKPRASQCQGSFICHEAILPAQEALSLFCFVLFLFLFSNFPVSGVAQSRG